MRNVTCFLTFRNLKPILEEVKSVKARHKCPTKRKMKAETRTKNLAKTTFLHAMASSKRLNSQRKRKRAIQNNNSLIMRLMQGRQWRKTHSSATERESKPTLASSLT